MPKRRSVVYVSERTKKKCELWGYGYADLALLLGATEGTVRNWVCRKKLAPHDLLTLFRFAVRKNPAIRQILMDELTST